MAQEGATAPAILLPARDGDVTLNGAQRDGQRVLWRGILCPLRCVAIHQGIAGHGRDHRPLVAVRRMGVVPFGAVVHLGMVHL
jgi:hypothetical protein